MCPVVYTAVSFANLPGNKEAYPCDEPKPSNPLPTGGIVDTKLHTFEGLELDVESRVTGSVPLTLFLRLFF